MLNTFILNMPMELCLKLLTTISSHGMNTEWELLDNIINEVYDANSLRIVPTSNTSTGGDRDFNLEMRKAAESQLNVHEQLHAVQFWLSDMTTKRIECQDIQQFFRETKLPITTQAINLRFHRRGYQVDIVPGSYKCLIREESEPEGFDVDLSRN